MMNGVNKTLYIPLYGKALVSQRGLLLHDPRAEEIWKQEGFALKGKSRSKWLAYYMGMRAAVFDGWVRQCMEEAPDAVILHLGCGMDSRAERVGSQDHLWLDVDFPEVIRERERYYRESENYKMVGADISSEDWLARVGAGRAIGVMEGVSMYLPPEELKKVLARLTAHFTSVRLLMDCYTELAAKASRVRNPINDVGVTHVFGVDDPRGLEGGGMRFVAERVMTPESLIRQLGRGERRIFKALYAGSIAKKMYRLYEFKS